MQSKQTTHHNFRVFHIPQSHRARRRGGAIVVAVVAALIWGIVIAGPYDPGWVFLGLPFTLGFLMHAVFQWFSTNKARIVVSSDGIEFHSLGYSHVSAWHWVGNLEYRQVNWWGRGRVMVECLPMPEYSRSGWLLWKWLDGTSRLGNAIPIEYFGDWKTGELGQAIAQYAPHLIPAPEPEPTPAGPSIVEQVVKGLFSSPQQGKD
jgi:hypothetical protein